MSSSGRVEPREVLIVGGGIAGIEALMALADLGDRSLRVRLVASHPSFVLRPQTLGEPWGGPPLRIDLERLCRAFDARFVKATVVAVDARRREVRTASGDLLRYERLLLAPGARLELPYATTRTVGFGLLPPTLATSAGGSVVIVAPPGVSWTLPAYELAILTAATGRDVSVLTAESTPLRVFGPAARPAILALLERHGVRVDLDGAPDRGAQINALADTVITLPLLHGPMIAGLPLDAAGFVRTDASMAVPGLRDVYVAGDAAAHAIKQGGLAAQQADTAAAQIVRSCGGTAPPFAYAPVLRGKLTAPDGEELYLRRRLDGEDDGRADAQPLWQPSGVVCAWRLARWLTHRRGELQPFTLDHVAQPTRS